MAATVWKTLKNRYNGRNSKDQTDLEIAYNSIEIMRINIQDSFDREIDGIVKKYIQVKLISFIEYKLQYLKPIFSIL